MSVDLVVLLLSDVTNLLLGIGILLRNPNDNVNRIFAGLSLAIITWTSCNYAADASNSSNLALLLSRLTLVAGLAILVAVVLLSRHFPRQVRRPSTLTTVQVPLLTIAALLTLTPLIIKSVTPTEQGASLAVGPLYSLFVIVIIQGSFVTIFNFFAQYRTATNQAEKSQIRVVLTGLILYAFFSIGSNVLLPVIVDNWRSSRFGPVFSLFIVGLTGYAIVKHRLFDIRPILARSMGYLFSLAVLSAAYGFFVFGIAQLVFGLHLSLAAQLFLSLATGVAGLLFQRFRKSFDKATNSIFFRDAYDPQELFDHLNKVLVSTVDINKLLKQSAESIAESLKPQYCVIGLAEQQSQAVRIIGTQKINFNTQDVARVRELTPRIHQTVIAADYLTQEDSDLKDLLVRNNVAALVRLSAGVGRSQQGIGYIVLGTKKSGNPYNVQDFRVLDTVAKELTIAIQNALRVEEIERFNVTLQQKVDEATRKLRRTNEKLKELDEAKDDFVSMASHQLRTPLTSIKGYTSMVLEGDAGKINATQRKLLEQSFFSSQRMVYLIADLLNVSRLKTGKFIIEPVPVNLAEVVQQEIVQLKETAAGRSLTLDYEMPKEFPTLLLDETKTRQVIMNFVDNAIYYTPAGGHIEVKLVETPASVELRVVDNGIGVPKAEQPHLFTKFYRAGNARKARPDGTGLGLFMAKKVVVAEGGAVIFETEEGKGSTFGFVFSKDKAVATSTQESSASAKATTTK